jgi:hypothetical protein
MDAGDLLALVGVLSNREGPCQAGVPRPVFWTPVCH